jgi:hypothetical protein
VLGNVGVNFIAHNGGSSILSDINFPPQVRTLHAALDIGNFDGYFNSDFANIIYSDIGFQELSPYAEVFDATTLLTLTPVGNSGATIHEADVSASASAKRTVVLAGVAGALLFIPLLDNARPLETFPIFRILNASFSTAFLDVYILPPGTPLEDLIIPQIRSIPTAADTGFAATSTGLLEFTVTLAGEKTPISTPLILDLANGDTVDAIIVDTVNPGTVELIVFDSQ